jgi:hypothetical protein
VRASKKMNVAKKKKSISDVEEWQSEIPCKRCNSHKEDRQSFIILELGTFCSVGDS